MEQKQKTRTELCEAVQKEEQSTASSESASSSQSTENKDDDVIDAEYTKE